MKTMVLLLLLAFGAVMALYQLDDGSAPSTRPAVAGRADAPTAPGPAPAVTPQAGPMTSDPDLAITQQNDILARPLFARSRKAGGDLQTTVAVAGAGVAEAQPARLLGVMIAPPMRRALLRFADGTPEWVSEGDVSRGWTVKAVTPRDAVLTGAGGDLTLELHATAAP